MPRIYGARYGQTAHLDLPAVARLIRADLKTAAAGDGPLKGLKFTVRTRNHGCALEIDIDGLPDGDVHQVDDEGRRRPAARANEVRDAVTAITAAYNWWNPEYRDVRFYVNPVVLDDDQRTYRASMAALKTSRT